MSKSNILIIMTGSIACYKACNVISKLIQNDYAVKVVLTKGAKSFITPMTIEGLTGELPYSNTFEPTRAMEHIHLAKWAHLILVMPTTANFINKISHGLADDLASTILLAHDYKKPLLIAPAMNTQMYTNPITQASIKKLTDLGVNILPTDSGLLACGEIGEGRLLDPEKVYSHLVQTLEKIVSKTNSNERSHKSVPKSDLNQKYKKSLNDHLDKKSQKNVNNNLKLKVLVTAGGTEEQIDSVRSITNTSTGKTGFQIAEHLSEQGLEVDLVTSKRFVSTFNSFAVESSGLNSINTFTDFRSLKNILAELLSKNHYAYFIHAAAVSDYSVDHEFLNAKYGVQSSTSKFNSNLDELTIRLKKNSKLIDQIKDFSINKNIKIIGFKLTSSNDEMEQIKAVTDLIKHSNADLVIQNDILNISDSRHEFNIFKQNVLSKPKVSPRITLSSSSTNFSNTDSINDSTISKIATANNSKELGYFINNYIKENEL